MAAESLERAVETFGMQICKTHPKLKGKTMRHADDDRAAESNCITFRATRGADRVDGPKGADVVLEVHCRSMGTPRENELIVTAIDEAFSDAYLAAHGSGTTAASVFARLDKFDERDGDRDDTKSLRKRTRSIPFFARLL